MAEGKHEGLQAVLEAGRLIGAGEQLAALELEVPHVLRPDGVVLESLEQVLLRPQRKRGCPTFTHERGFTAYVNDHKDDASRLYADLTAATMTAVLNHHEAVPNQAAARWGDHRAHFAPPKDLDWVTWTEQDDTPMDQMEFAQFVEDNLPAIVAPDGAELLELAQHLESTSKVSFKSAERLAGGGRSFAYEEQAQNRLGKGKVELPEEFELRLPVFLKGDKVSLTAKLRYRIKEGALLLWYHLHRPHDAHDEAFQRLMDGVGVATGLTAWPGTPAKADQSAVASA